MKAAHLDIAWYLLLVACVAMAAYQIVEMVTGWVNRPIDYVEERIPKQEVPFPSITICPEGTTLWPALESFLSDQPLRYESFPKALQSYMRIQLYQLANHIGATEKVIREQRPNFESYFNQGCSAKNHNLEEFCSFYTLISNSIAQKYLQGTLYQETVDLVGLLSKKMHFYPDKMYKFNPLKNRFKYIPEVQFAGVKNSPKKHLSMLVAYFLYANMMRVVVEKAKNESVDVMQTFLDFVDVNSTSIKNTSSKCRNSRVSTLTKVKNNIEILLTDKYFVDSKTFWKGKFQHVAYKNVKVNCVTFYHEIFVAYYQLIYLQAFQPSSRLSSYITQLLNYDAKYSLPLETVLEHTEEINVELSKTLSTFLNVSSVPWSLRDTIDLLTTNGFYRLKAKTSMQKVEETKRKLRCMRNESCWNNLVEYDKKLMVEGFGDDKEFPDMPNLLMSTSVIDRACFQAIDYYDPFSVCKNTSCREFCKKLKMLTKVPRVKELFDVLKRTSHSGMLQTLGQKINLMGKLIPFCFHGRQMLELVDSLSEFKNFPFKDETGYGYDFCQKSQQMFTDIGLCTTYNFPDDDNIIKANYFNLEHHRKGRNKSWQPIYPQKMVTNSFEDGLLLILDSWNFKGYYAKNRDNSLGSLPKDTILESSTLDKYLVILHTKDEIPLIYHPEGTHFAINDNGKYSTDNIMKTYLTKVRVEIDDADESIKSTDLSYRQCKFEDETEGITMFSKYSQSNCLYECKLKIAKRKCNCTPWNFPRDNQEPLCDLLGSICFQHEIVWLKKHLSEVVAGDPPCGCYPSCKTIRYIPDSEKPQHSTEGTRQWLQAEKVKKALTKAFFNYSMIDQYTKESKYQQFLYHYAMDTFRGQDSQLQPGRDMLGETLTNDFLNILFNRKGSFRSRVKNIVIWQLDFDKNFYVVRRKIRRMSFADMVSAFGGTLGLFTGFSFVGLFNVFVWLRNLCFKN